MWVRHMKRRDIRTIARWRRRAASGGGMGRGSFPRPDFRSSSSHRASGIVRHDRPLGRDIPGNSCLLEVGRTARPLELSWAPRRSRPPPLTAILVIHGLPRRELSCSPSTDDLSRATRSRARGAARSCFNKMRLAGVFTLSLLLKRHSAVVAWAFLRGARDGV